MLRITCELLPFGKEAAKVTLSVLDIINTGTGNVDVGNYKVNLKGQDDDLITAEFNNFRRSRGHLACIKTALAAILKVL